MFNTKLRLREAYELLSQVEEDIWLLNWNADQEQEGASALNRLGYLIQSLSKKELPDLKKAAGDSGYSMGFNC